MLKEFLVSIGYGEKGRDDWKRALAQVDEGIKKIRSELDGLAREMAKAFERTMIGSAAVEFAAQRCGTSSQSLLALSYSLQQSGIGADAMMRSINGLATKLRILPNTEGIIRWLGVQTRAGGKLRDNADVLLDVLDVLGKQDYILAAHNASLLGISEQDYAQLRARASEIRKGVEEAKALMANMGVDKDKMGQGAILLMASWRLLTAQLELVMDTIMMGLAPVLKPIIDDLNQWIKDHNADIVEFCRRLVEAAAGIAEDLRALVVALGPVWEAFSSLIRATTGTDGLVVAFAAIGGAYMGSIALGFLGPLGLVLAAVLGGASVIAATVPGSARTTADAGDQKGRGEKRSLFGRMKDGVYRVLGIEPDNWGEGGAGEPFEPNADGESVGELSEERKRFAEELKDPAVSARLAAYTEAEVGSQGPAAQQAFIETIMNRAAARGQSLKDTLSGSYFPSITHSKAAGYAADGKYVEKHRASINRVLGGSNVSGYATGNASGTVGFGGGPQTSAYGGERFGVEKPDIGWAARVRERARRRAEEEKREKRSSLGAPFSLAERFRADPLMASPSEAFDGRVVQVTDILVQGDSDPGETSRNILRAQQRTNDGVLSIAQANFA